MKNNKYILWFFLLLVPLSPQGATPCKISTAEKIRKTEFKIQLQDGQLTTLILKLQAKL